MKRKRRVSRLVVAAVFAVLIVVFFFGILIPDRLVYQGDVTSSDITELNFPRRDLLARELKKGDLPLWSPFIGNGFPLLAEGQTGIFYPPNLVLFGLLDSVSAYNFSVILSFVLALCFTYLLARTLARSRAAAVFAAVAFSFSAYFTARIKFMGIINGICWLPLALYAVEKAYQSRRAGYGVLAGVALAMQILAGFVQMFYISALLTLSLLAFRFASDFLNRRKSRRGAAGAVKLGALVLVLLAVVSFALPAIQVLPTASGVPSSNRAGGITFENATVFSMNWADLLLFAWPYAYGNPAINTYTLARPRALFWENCAYCGLAALLLALLAAMVTIRRERETRFWIGALLVSILLALGSATPFFGWIFGWFPGMDLFRFPQRFLLVAAIAIALLGARGVDWLRTRSGRYRVALPIALVAILVVDLAVFAHLQIGSINSGELLTPPNTLEAIEADAGEEPYRIAQVGHFYAWRQTREVAGGWIENTEPYLNYRAMLQADYSMVFDVENMEAQGNYGLEWTKRLWMYVLDEVEVDAARWTVRIPDTVLKLLSIQNVRYIFASQRMLTPGLPPLAGVAFTGEQRGIGVYENPSWLARARLVSDYRVEENMDDEAIGDLFGESFDPVTTVLLEEEPGRDIGSGRGGAARILSYDDLRVVVEVDSYGDNLLVLADTFADGWDAWVDGDEAEILRANYAFRAVEVDDGAHTVVFEYHPEGYNLGIAVTAVTSLLLLAWLVALATARKRLKLLGSGLRI